MIEVLAPGPFTTVQDGGRRGRGHQGVARSGAFDWGAFELANRLVGNDTSAAVLEALLGPVTFRALSSLAMAVAGTETTVEVEQQGGDRSTYPASQALYVHERSLVTVRSPRVGLRTIIAFRGGVDVAQVLGSRSYDSLGQIGPPPLAAGDRIDLGALIDAEPWFDHLPQRPASRMIPFSLGPRDAWLAANGLAVLLGQQWSIDPGSNRTGVRLQGDPVPRHPGELASEAMIPGAIQLPGSGLPIVLGPDGGTTGGYPVIGVVTRQGLDRLAQARPGDSIQLQLVR